MKETHIFLSINKKDILEDSSNNSKILTIISDKENRFELAYKIINSLDISKLSSQPQIVETQNKKRGNVSKNCEYKSKKYLIDDNNEHFFFHIYTGEIVDPYDPTMNYSQYDIDYNYVQYLENKVLTAYLRKLISKEIPMINRNCFLNYGIIMYLLQGRISIILG